ncbi:MAG TPA: cytochrome c oxidase assembly protein [Solirubrobacteraceae bacterium]|nr:cytochrome c oxidase assembly protein [Solirubrobacteraceae bacterium]
MAIVVWLLLAEGLYLRALRILRSREVAVPRWQIAAWHAGIALQAIGLLSPIDRLAEDGLSFHMAQHLMIADLAGPLLLAGMRNPVLAFLLPRDLLVGLARSRRLRGAFRTLRQPLVSLPVYALVLYGWHFSFAFEAAVRHPLVHAAQHASFVAIGMLVWWPALEPKRRRLRGELWKIGHVLAARFLGMFLGMSFVLIRQPVYTDVYGAGDRVFGMTAVADQQLAGGMMVLLDIVIMVFALGFFFLRAGQEHDRSERRDAALTSR